MDAHLFCRETPAAFSLSPIGTSAPAFRRVGADGAGRMPERRAGAGKCELMLKARSDWWRADHRLWSSAIHTGAALNLQAQLD
jgi:hypothetical protein